ncbi:MAG: hypothetical protein GAK34_02790 [Delftia tsuruhatensis]|nr:MAG: hypothetical protein GAK34_02790 [Delftia tsuruhatensis]
MRSIRRTTVEWGKVRLSTRATKRITDRDTSSDTATRNQNTVENRARISWLVKTSTSASSGNSAPSSAWRPIHTEGLPSLRWP